ncbi:hypothetical protein DPM19_16310 [Actinomadura craniellae]|uniref:DUF1579 domain-containing protein n=1 Tax=Actinomadura craniellae TaxID=2231787 RepID=A0A365H436_9ACTN|nr:hypothetical protein [Actinomadura craniellae]RAY13870.1 hypothetical protein DPM19_16310 [Actinomadura craniellae]
MRPIVLLTVAGALILSGCDGGAGAADPSPSGHGAATSAVGPLPSVAPQQVARLVGTWRGATAAKDYFVFRADGTGSWMARGQTLWNGQAIPDRGDRFRLSWQGGDPKDATYWSVRLTEGGKKMVFEGTNQVYAKAAR